MSRPKILSGKTIQINVGCGKMYVTLNEHEGKLYEVFVVLGRSGACMMSQTETIGRLISIALQKGSAVEEIIDQLKGIRCVSPSYSEGVHVLSCADAIAHVLEEYLKEKSTENVNNLSEGGKTDEKV